MIYERVTSDQLIRLLKFIHGKSNIVYTRSFDRSGCNNVLPVVSLESAKAENKEADDDTYTLSIHFLQSYANPEDSGPQTIRVPKTFVEKVYEILNHSKD